MPQTCDGFVIEVDVCDLDISRQTVGVNGKSVVVSSDLDLTCRQVFDRLVAAAVAEF